MAKELMKISVDTKPNGYSLDVEVNMSRVLCEALCQKLSKQNLIAS